MLSDLVRVNDAGRISLRGKSAYEWGQESSVVEVKGWVRALCRERGKIVPGSFREGHNVWTNTGREFLAMLMTYQLSGPPNGYRNDRVAYIGVGKGLQSEDASVAGLKDPLPYAPDTFLAHLDHSGSTFPLSPTRTTVRYVRVFGENEITLPGSDSVLISELGLFTDGDQNSFDPVSPGRARGLSVAAYQSPVAYKNLPEPIEKTSGLEFQIEWEVRF